MFPFTFGFDGAFARGARDARSATKGKGRKDTMNDRTRHTEGGREGGKEGKVVSSSRTYRSDISSERAERGGGGRRGVA